MSYWVITSGEGAFGPFDDFDTAYEYGLANICTEQWTVTTTS